MDNFIENGLIIPENLMKVQPSPETLAKHKQFKDNTLFQTSSPFHEISIVENETGRFLKYGISIQAGKIATKDYSGNIPYLNYFLQTYIKKNAKKILIIGFGIGYFVNQIEKLFCNLERIDAVDIEENILNIATKYFNFKASNIFHFYLQDALVYLRNNKTKYDIIITDIAGDEGIDERFFEDDFFINIKKSLKKDGIFAFNSCANIDFKDNDNSFFAYTVEKYKEHFNNFAVFNGNTSDLTTFKSLYGINERYLDITNAIIIASDTKIKEETFKNISQADINKINSLGVNIIPYTKDLHKVYTNN